MLNQIETFYADKSITLNDGTIITIVEVLDYQCEDRPVGILSGYACILDTESKEYVIFDDGEVQDDNGNVVGKLNDSLDDLRYAGWKQID